MFRRVRPLLAAVTAALLLTSCLLPAYAESLPSGVEKSDIGSKIEAFVAEHEATTAGMAVAVFDQDGVIYENRFGYADVEAGRPVDEDTVFEWGSVTKLTVWVSVMQLWEQGKLDLNADVRDYLPEGFLTNLRYDEPLTMTDLMNHRGGFQEVLVDLFLPEGSEIPDLETALRHHQPEQIYPPDTVTAYSNWGVALAAYIVERVSGESYADYVHAHIFAPLGMEHTAVRPDLSDNPWVQGQRKLLRGYTSNVTRIQPDFYHISLYPAGMATGTLSDFTVFARALLAEDCPLFASPDTWQALFTPTSYYGDSGIPRNSHGFWWLRMGVDAVGHGGNTAHCSSYLLLSLDDGVGCVIMTNQQGESVYNGEMVRLIFGTYTAPADRQLPTGVYRSARIVASGVLKCTGLSYIAYSEASADPNEFFYYQRENGLSVVSYPYTDVLEIPLGTLIPEVGLTVLWAVGILFSAVYLLAVPVGWAYRKLRKRSRTVTRTVMLRRSAAALQVLLAGLVTVMVVLLLSYAPRSAYFWLPLYLIVGIAMAVLFVLLLFSHKENRSKKEAALTAATLVFLLAAVGSIVYWQLYRFWVF